MPKAATVNEETVKIITNSVKKALSGIESMPELTSRFKTCQSQLLAVLNKLGAEQDAIDKRKAIQAIRDGTVDAKKCLTGAVPE